MVNIIVFSQNLMLTSLVDYLSDESLKNNCIFVTPHKLFEFEKIQIKKITENPTFYSFSDLLTDKDEETIDSVSYKHSLRNVLEYYDAIKEKKNQLIINKLLDGTPDFNGIIFSDDLGICLPLWISAGFKEAYGNYYYTIDRSISHKRQGFLGSINSYLNNQIYKSKTKDGKKVLFYGNLDRVGYRIDLTFQRTKIENIKYIIQKILFKFFRAFPCSNKVVRLSSIHESIKWNFPNYARFKIGVIQDGFLPDNYSSRYLKFVGNNITYLAWDKIGCSTFKYHKLPYSILPYRNKIYLPYPVFSNSIKKILFSASGAGDWTALKNRSDDDNLVIVAGELAKRFPEIQIIFRCHPSWIHPSHQGINSVNRVMKYFESLGIKNIILSGNIPEVNLNNYKLSFSRNSYEKDLENVDLVIGEHSISMIDAAIKQIPFISVNVTGRRDFFSSITRLGFPHAENLEELITYINNYGTSNCVDSFDSAVDNYNSMTNEE